jgi:tRNA(Ile)-lysidine synthase
MVNLSVIEQLLNHINRYALCKTTDKILLAVSGGLDSMVMFHLLHEAGFQIAVAHCNFQLRGAEALKDEELVRQTCLKWNIPFFVKRFETTAHATREGISVQMAARVLRYAFFNELIETQAYDYVATAHHFNDSIETIFMNLVRGTGIEGFTGIAPKKEKIIRPLLFATRKMLLAYALSHHLSWREDASNLSDEYHRNFLRHQIIPGLEELNPNFEETFRDTHERLLGACDLAKAFLKGFESSAVQALNNKTAIDIRKIRQSESPSVILWELIKGFGFNFDQCRQVVRDHQPGKRFFSPSHQLLIDRQHYIIEKKEDGDFTPVSIETGEHMAANAQFVLTFKEVLHTEFQLVKDSTLAQLDADQLRYPLIWRRWRAGDYFMPLGMHQEKKLSDFLIDLKVPFNSKADITVLESGGHIIWVVGFRISERFKVMPHTKRVLIIEQKISGH